MAHNFIRIGVTHTKYLSNLEEYTYNLCILLFHACKCNIPPPYIWTHTKKHMQILILLNYMHAEMSGMQYTDGLHLTLKYTRNKMY